jgi:1-pyrroline-5-carboxylate dehydrogenase
MKSRIRFIGLLYHSSMNARISSPKPVNEPIFEYRPGSPERAKLQARLQELKAEKPVVPLYIGDKEVRTGKLSESRSPYDHSQIICKSHDGGAKETNMAINAALKARKAWAATPHHERAAIFLKAADLLAGDFRYTLNAATMLGQSKNCHQAEIDSACELIDFLRFNCAFAEQIQAMQPESSKGMWNQLEYRPLEGFIFASTPFNFTAIAGNLPAAPALMGNTVVWKPSQLAMFSAYHLMRLFKAAGLPDGVINMVAGEPAEISKTALEHPMLAGVHFTGSTAVFQSMWASVGANIGKYKSYPRLVGETGGKDFVMVHPSADVDAVAAGLVRGAFEFQGQKCSAASRAYIPDNLWPKLKPKMGDMISSMKMGSPEDFSNYINAVIDRKAFDRVSGYISRARKSPDCKVLWGGRADDMEGYFVSPTVIQTTDPKYESMVQEIFGPVLSVHVYPAKRFSKTLELVDASSPYALTGSIFSQDRDAVQEAKEKLVNAAGNFYVNDKPTGAVVGQQPFGGARASGTNDKAGSPLNLLRWTSPRTIKETFDPPKDYRYAFLGEQAPAKAQAPAAAAEEPAKPARKHAKA